MILTKQGKSLALVCFLAVMVVGVYLFNSSCTKSEAGISNKTDLVEYFTDGTYTLNGVTDCMPGSTVFTSTSVKVSGWNDLMLYVYCSNVDSTMTGKYQTSPDNSTWYDGLDTLVTMDNNYQVINISENAPKWVRGYVDYSAEDRSVDSTATVQFALTGKRY